MSHLSADGSQKPPEQLQAVQLGAPFVLFGSLGWGQDCSSGWGESSWQALSVLPPAQLPQGSQEVLRNRQPAQLAGGRAVPAPIEPALCTGSTRPFTASTTASTGFPAAQAHCQPQERRVMCWYCAASTVHGLTARVLLDVLPRPPSNGDFIRQGWRGTDAHAA